MSFCPFGNLGQVVFLGLAASVFGAGPVQGFPPELFKKTKMCKFYARGCCTRGVECSFAHGDLELRDEPDLRKTEFCWDFWQKGACKDGADCRYAHSYAEKKRWLRPKVAHSLRPRQVVSQQAPSAPHAVDRVWLSQTMTFAAPAPAPQRPPDERVVRPRETGDSTGDVDSPEGVDCDRISFVTASDLEFPPEWGPRGSSTEEAAVEEEPVPDVRGFESNSKSAQHFVSFLRTKRGCGDSQTFAEYEADQGSLDGAENEDDQSHVDAKSDVTASDLGSSVGSCFFCKDEGDQGSLDGFLWDENEDDQSHVDAKSDVTASDLEYPEWKSRQDSSVAPPSSPSPRGPTPGADTRQMPTFGSSSVLGGDEWRSQSSSPVAEVGEDGRMPSSDEVRLRLGQPAGLLAPRNLFKTEWCKFYARKSFKDGCKKGDTCPYAHFRGEKKQKIDLSKTQLCRYFVPGRGVPCPFGDKCPFAHSGMERRLKERERRLKEVAEEKASQARRQQASPSARDVIIALTPRKASLLWGTSRAPTPMTQLPTESPPLPFSSPASGMASSSGTSA